MTTRTILGESKGIELSDKGDRQVTSLRQPVFDAMKGVGIFLVVLGHVTRDSSLFSFIYAFHMPLFFAISGYFFKSRSGTELVCRRIKGIVIPYFVLAIVSFCYWALIESRLRGGYVELEEASINILLACGGPDKWPFNSALWFLPCLFLTELVYLAAHSVISRVGNQSECRWIEFFRRLALLTACIIFASYWISGVCPILDIRLPWMADVVPAALIFYSAGSFISMWREDVVRISTLFRRKRLVGVCLAIICYGIVFFCVTITNTAVNYMELIFPSCSVLLILGCLGIAATFFIASAFSDVQLFNYLGNHSLSIMGLHEPIKRVVIVAVAFVFSAGVDWVRHDLLLSIFASLLTIAITCLVAWLATRVSEWLRRCARSSAFI